MRLAAIRESQGVTSTQNLIRDRASLLDGLTVQYRRQSVNNLSISTITFWNGGGAAIRRGDIASADPLHIEAATPATQLLGTHLGYNG